jgi:hypothetical protein
VTDRGSDRECGREGSMIDFMVMYQNEAGVNMRRTMKLQEKAFMHILLGLVHSSSPVVQPSKKKRKEKKS